MPESTSAGPSSQLHQVLTIGRTADNDIVLNYPMVSARHARLVVANGRVELEDLGSSNGTAVGRPDRRITRTTLVAGDVVYFGSLPVPAARLLAALAGQPATAVPFRGPEMILGRLPGCDEVLPYPMISARHARLRRAGPDLVLEDLGSTNGTFLNGRRITRPTTIRPGDVIALGTYTLTLTGPGGLEKRDQRGQVTLEARNVTVDVGRRRLLEPVSFTLLPGELVGLMGPSGAGKTMLLNALNGYTPPSAGAVFLNGLDLHAHFDRFRTTLGYVPQEDILHRELTVREALTYTARLRLPPDTSRAEIRDRVRLVIEQLGLEGTEDLRIGTPEKRGISGGQRKRVNLALELLTDPLVLFLDEPTSGLSSEDALMVVRLLRNLADAGKTILLTIHQPSRGAYRLLDNVAVVTRDARPPGPGVLAYYGPASPDALHFFNAGGISESPSTPDPSPDDLLRGLSRRPAAEWAARFQESRCHAEYVAARAGQQPAGVRPGTSPSAGLWFNLTQGWTLLRRGLAIKVSDRLNTIILLAQAPVVALLIVLVFGKQVSEPITAQNGPQVARALGITLFLMTLAALWFGSSSAIREIVGEWAVYRRERMVNLRLPPYLLSKIALLGGLGVVQCAVLLIITQAGCGLKGPWLPLYGVLLLAALVGVVMGLALSAVARTADAAIALLPILLLAMVILGGVMQPLHKMHPATRLLCNAIPSRWAFEGVLLLESEHRPEIVSAADPTGRTKEDMAEAYFPKQEQRSGLGTSVGALVALAVLVGGLVLVTLRLRDVPRR